MFSIVIPVYNRADRIASAIESVLRQTVADWELLIVDDGSTDSLEDAIAPYRSDPRIQVIHQKNGGVSSARNTGIKRAKGEYLCFLDSDDEWKKEHIETMAVMIGSFPDSGLYGSSYDIVLPSGRILSTADYFTNLSAKTMQVNFIKSYSEDKRAKIFCMDTICIPQKVFEKIGNFFYGSRMGEDLDLMLRISCYYPVVVSSTVTAVYHREESIATKEFAFDVDWCFFDHSQQILRDPAVTKDTARHLRRLMGWFEMRRCRHLIMAGRRHEAWAAFFRMGKDVSLLKDKAISAALLLMPSSVVRAIHNCRWRNQG